MIIIEGPDNTGKSTLVAHLEQSCGLPTAPSSKLSKKERNSAEFRSQEAVRDRVWEAVYHMVGGWEAPCLHDRLFFSELIYSHVYGRECAFNFYESRHICRLMQACHIPVIFCIPPFKVLMKEFLGAEQMEGLPEHIKDVYNGYVLLAKNMSRRKIKGVTNRDQPFDYNFPKVYLYDYTRGGHKQKIENIVKDYIRIRKMRSGGWYEGPADNTFGRNRIAI